MAVEESIFDQEMGKTPANHQPLTPLSFLAWAARVYPNKIAVVHGESTFTYREFATRCRLLASALKKLGISKGDTVAIMSPNAPPMLEAHYGVPMSGAILNALNFRLDGPTLAFTLQHCEAKILITDTEFSSIIKDALAHVTSDLLVIDIDDPLGAGGERLGEIDYDTFLSGGDYEFAQNINFWPTVVWPDDEWDAICLNYTSGTTGNPKGVVFHHRGAFLNAMGGLTVSALSKDSVYLWTLPMFHCNGWCYTWAVTAAGGTHVCLRQVETAQIFLSIRNHGVNVMCGAPIILNMILHAPETHKVTFDQQVTAYTGGAAPPSAVIAGMERLGFKVVHLYGLTETYGPSTFCAWQDAWDELGLEEKAQKMARQGVRYPTLFDQSIIDPETMEDVPADGKTIGELMIRSNTVMKGYLKNPTATDAAFAGGWFHTGDLGVLHSDGYIEIKDRSKDIIISGGENISSLEVEEALYKHPKIMEAAVVARPDEKWGETPCAFVTLVSDDATVDEADVIEYCRTRMASFKVPRTVVFGPLPKTSTGKIQKYVLRERAKELS
ncbi:MAG: acyl-CoA synthetase [Rhodospirillaceae bacterium TMED8]|nr:acyl-CoA synthetase [Magnetovibrio sp.]OUT49021.1 MAG: acyl-CoA synthetase [Rhodospirillaceae bacterium TMED8]